MERRSWIGACVGILGLTALGYGGWRTFGLADADECYACKRPLHAHSKTVAMVDGHPRVFCCPACALSQRAQAGKTIQITQLTSFADGKTLSPENAYVVKGSNVNMCERTQELIQEDKRSAGLNYDRCAPSLIAFAQRSEARDFAREHGGEVLAFQDAAAALTR
ncbi:MAG: nitrous oxide reductase accessory protein NosL [Ignavibacteriota bacterium]